MRRRARRVRGETRQATDMTVVCRQCGSASLASWGEIPTAALFAGQLLDPPWHGGRLHECRSCHLGFRHPIRAESEYERLYKAASEKVWVTEGLRADQKRLARMIGAKLTTGCVLDVGCYDGSLLQALGSGLRKFGVEPSVLAADVARSRGVTIVAQHIRELAAVSQSFDVICAVDVIEHVPDPGTFVESLTRLLSPGGWLLISSGSLDTPAWRRAGGQYWYCGFPEHISFISQAWGESVAARLGLTLCEMERFAYLELPPRRRAVAVRRFYLKVFRRQLASRLCAWFAGRKSRNPERSLGQPGVFVDHLVLGFRKPVVRASRGLSHST